MMLTCPKCGEPLFSGKIEFRGELNGICLACGRSLLIYFTDDSLDAQYYHNYDIIYVRGIDED